MFMNASFGTLMWIASINGARVGAQLVIAAWSAVALKGSVAAPGVVFAGGCILASLSAPWIGRWVSVSSSKKHLMQGAHCAMAAMTLCIASTVQFTAIDPFLLLAIFYACTTSIAQISGSATDYFLKGLSQDGHLQNRIAKLSAVGQLAMIGGTAAAGAGLSSLALVPLLIVLASCNGVCAAIVMFRLPDLRSGRPDQLYVRKPRFRVMNPFACFSRGESQIVLVPIMLMVLAYAVGQMTNVLLPALVQLQRGGSSADYAALEIGWAVGALTGSGWLFLRNKASVVNAGRDAMIVAFMATAVIAVPLTEDRLLLLAIPLFLGGGFSMVRVRGETRFLTLCAPAALAHYRAISNVLMQLTALLAFLLPVMAPEANAAALYRYAGATVAALAIVMLVIVTRQRKPLADPPRR